MTNPGTPSETGLDLLVVDANLTQPLAFAFKGNKDGTFGTSPIKGNSYTVGVNPTKVVVGSFEGNGIQDVAILNEGSSTIPGTVTELSGLGDGTFATPTNFDVGPTPTGLVQKFFPGDQLTPGLTISNNVTPTGLNTPIDVRINLRQLSPRRSNGLAITGTDSDQNLIQGNSIGVDVNGNQARGNAASGVFIEYDGGSGPTRQGNTIGGSASGERNVISGNVKDGVTLVGKLDASQGDQILGNFIGLDFTGRTAFDPQGQVLGNGLNGILIEGLAATVSGNVISGNGLSGIDVAQRLRVNPGTTKIFGNKIGTDATGTMATEVRTVSGQPVPVLFPLGNALDGVLLDNVNNVSVGGTTTAERNLISGNLGRGIEVRGYLVPGSGQVSIGSNLIGTDITGQYVTQVEPTDPSKRSASLSLGNLGDGIFLLNATGTLIQGSAGAPIVVSGNRGFGVHAVGDGVTASNLKLSGVFVGTDQTGNKTAYLSDPTKPDSTVIFLGNGSDGIFLDRVVGTRGVDTISDSVISGNRSNGIQLLDSSLVTIVRNNIGSGLSGTGVTPGNSATGIFLNDSSDITIGGTTTNANTISGNQVYGVAISAPVGGVASRTLLPATALASTPGATNWATVSPAS